jgi:hypothetical protein
VAVINGIFNFKEKKVIKSSSKKSQNIWHRYLQITVITGYVNDMNITLAF